MPRASRHRRSPPTATCCSSRCARPRTTTSRPLRCGTCPRPAARPSRSWHRQAASKPSGRRAAARGSWCVHRCCRRRAPSTTTVGCGICARTPRSPRSCTPAIRSGTGTRISAPPPRTCSHWIEATSPLPADLTPRPGAALRDADFDVSGDGSFVVTSWQRPAPDASLHSVLVRIDVATGEHTVIADEPDADLFEPGHLAGRVGGGVHSRVVLHTEACTANQLELLGVRRRTSRISRRTGIAGPRRSRGRTTATSCSSPPTTAAAARCSGYGIDDGSVEPLTTDDFAYTDVATAPDGVVYALRSSYAAPPHPVRIDPRRHRHGAAVRRAARAARLAHRGRRDGRRRDRGAVVAGAAGRARTARAAPAVGPRRTAGQLELLALAVEPVGARGARLRRAAARPGAVDRLRAGLHPARLGQLGRRTVRRPDGRHRRRVCSTRASTPRAPP